jgi:hypothetical protein
MSNINQLLAKALSTTSEDEAMACLRMARKKGGRLENSSVPAEHNGHDAKYWYEKAAMYYTKAKEKSEGLTPTQQQQLWNMYKNESESVLRLRSEKQQLEREINQLKSKPTGVWKIPLITVQFFVIIVLLLQFTG